MTWLKRTALPYVTMPLLDKTVNAIERALVLILPVEFHCRCVVRICSQVLLVI